MAKHADKHAEKKTNAMRELDTSGQPYQAHWFECPEALSGVEVAHLLKEDPDCVFKTLVTVGKSGDHYVFMIPVALELDLKKAATVGLTGYVHGGCSPLGMKKRFVTTIDESAALYETIFFSGGKIGCQIETSLDALKAVLPVGEADLTA